MSTSFSVSLAVPNNPSFPWDPSALSWLSNQSHTDLALCLLQLSSWNVGVQPQNLANNLTLCFNTFIQVLNLLTC